MINTMVACLGVEHRKLNGLNMQLAYGATRLASDGGATEANKKVLRVWDEIQQDLWSHLQIEDGLLSWGEAHHAISGALLDTRWRGRSTQTSSAMMVKSCPRYSARSSPNSVPAGEFHFVRRD